MATRKEEVKVILTAKDKATRTLKKTENAFGGVKKAVLNLGIAYGALRLGKELLIDSTLAAAKFEATLVSLNAVAMATGRDVNQIYAEMNRHLGGLANKSQTALGFLRGLTTELTVEQVSNLTQAIKDASIAMGESYNVQLPLIMRAIKQLNPMLLDNIGVTVRLDRVNAKIRDGYYGLNRAITETTQQNAIYQEVLKQTAKFRGQEAKFLETTAGKLGRLTVAYEDLQVAMGEVTLDLGEGEVTVVDHLTAGVVALTVGFNELSAHIERGFTLVGALGEVFSTFFDTQIRNIQNIGTAFDSLFSLDFQQLAIDIAAGLLDGTKGADELSAAVERAKMGFVDWGVSNIMVINAVEKAYTDYLDTVRGGTQQVFDDTAGMIVVNGIRIKESIDDWAEHAIDTTMRLREIAGPIHSELQEEIRREMEETARHAARANQQMERSAGRFAARTISTFVTMKGSAKKIFKQIAGDFVNFFINTVLAKMAPGGSFISGFLGALKLFDVPANDRMAMQMGRDYASFFTAGVNEGMAGFGNRFTSGMAVPGPMLNAANGPASGVTVNLTINGDADESMIERLVVPAIEKMSQSLQTTIVTDINGTTGEFDFAT